MDSRIDIVRLFPELAAIDHTQLQTYCDAWRQRPVARQFAISQIVVDDERKLLVSVDISRVRYYDERIIFPIDELLGYFIDQHFTDADERSALHDRVRNARRNWEEIERDYQVVSGHLRRLYLACKNPACQAEIETTHHATEHQSITCPPTSLTCPACGYTAMYEGGDLHFLAGQ